MKIIKKIIVHIKTHTIFLIRNLIEMCFNLLLQVQQVEYNDFFYVDAFVDYVNFFFQMLMYIY